MRPALLLPALLCLLDLRAQSRPLAKEDHTPQSLLALAETFLPLGDKKAPRTLDELWAGYDPRREPLAAEVTKEWEQDGVVCRVVRYRIGVFKGRPATMAAFYAFPKGAKGLPGLMHIHGGGQSASLATVVTDARRGYASLSLNWGGNRMTLADGKPYDGPGTDWGALDATHPPQRNPVNHFANGIKPDAFTLDAVESPRNSNWFLVMVAARRGLSFLEAQPEADPARLGVYGHSMGGRLTTQLAGIDSRVKAAVPSCGGSGDLTASLEEMPGGSRGKVDELELAAVSSNPYIRRLTVPTLWLSPTNDFHAQMDNMAWNWRDVPDALLRLSMSPHLNHRHDNASALTQHLWFEQHLKGRPGLIPATPALRLELGREPRIAVTPDPAKPCQEVRIYYTQDTHALSRFWRRADARREDGRWIAEAPLLDTGRPLFAYASAVYTTPEEYRKLPTTPGVGNSDTYFISTREAWATAAQLRKAGAAATDAPDRVITGDSGDWGDWYVLNAGHPTLWSLHTRKIKDPKWRGPSGARLSFRIAARQEGWICVRFLRNEWGAFGPEAKGEYAVAKELKPKDGWAEITIELAEVRPLGGTKGALADWSTLTELSITPVIPKELRTAANDSGNAWTKNQEPLLRDLRWIGGVYGAPTKTGAELPEAERAKAFNEAIRSSLEQEARDRAR